MAQTIHQLVVEGADRGKEIPVPAEGVRVGRSSRNDVVLRDDSMSRFHCRFELKAGDGLWVMDLGSSNQTLVNGQPATEQRLRVGDRVTIGGTIVRVVHDGSTGAEAGSAPVAPAPAPAIDLGLSIAPAAAKPKRTRTLLWLAAAMVLVAALAWLPKLKLARSITSALRPGVPTEVKPAASLPTLDLAYEKVDATASNIFRYALSLADGTLAVQIDDVRNQRHVRREARVDPAVIENLARALESSGFLDLLASYEGLAPGIHEAYDLTVTLGPRTQRVRVVNRVEPEAFASARTMVEEFGMNTLGLAALALEPAALLAKARDAYLSGRRLSDEREVHAANLSLAIRAYKETEWYLETIEPKPDFYAEALSRKADSERELQTRFDNLWFLSERAIKLADWKEAAKNLRQICDMIPDRSDERNRNAFKKLIDVERHLEPNR
jgi:hypothetical protein